MNWSDEEEITALNLAMHGYPRYAIADRLKRSGPSVGAKLRRLWKRGDTWISRYDAFVEKEKLKNLSHLTGYAAFQDSFRIAGNTLRKHIGLILKSDIRYPLKKKVDALVRKGYTSMEAIDIVLETKTGKKKR